MDASVGDHRDGPLVRVRDVGEPIVLEEGRVSTMSTLELGEHRPILDETGLDHCPAAHQPWKHAALGEVHERVSAFRVDRPEYASSVNEHVTGRIAEGSGDAPRDFAFRYSNHYCWGGFSCADDTSSCRRPNSFEVMLVIS